MSLINCRLRNSTRRLNQTVRSSVPHEQVGQESRRREELVECAVCCERYTNSSEARAPRILLCCSNTFCTECLRSLIYGRNKRCPNCRVPILESDITKFPINRTILKLLDIEELCSSCKMKHKTISCSCCNSYLCSACYEHHNKGAVKELIVQKLSDRRERSNELILNIKQYCDELMERVALQINQQLNALNAKNENDIHGEDYSTILSEERNIEMLIKTLKRILKKNEILVDAISREIQVGPDTNEVAVQAVVKNNHKVLLVIACYVSMLMAINLNWLAFVVQIVVLYIICNILGLIDI